nr:cupin domain-containing protein [Rhodococcus sp. (in: high G+C Gram-positive bacteria)]
MPYELDPETVLEGDPKQAVVVLSRSEDGTTVSGIFTSTPGTVRVPQAGDEWTVVRKGRLRVTSEDGSVVDCGPGQMMMLKRDTSATFEVLEELEDYFVIHHPDGVEL